jgi:hypothetical protein
MEKETFGTFMHAAKEHSRNWFETRLNLCKLKGIRLFAKMAGNFTWLIISLFLFFLFSVFAGLTLGFWLSSYLGNYTAGFGIVTLLIMLKIGLLALFRKKLFINPVIRKMIKQSCNEFSEEEGNKNN